VNGRVPCPFDVPLPPPSWPDEHEVALCPQPAEFADAPDEKASAIVRAAIRTSNPFTAVSPLDDLTSAAVFSTALES
jgi:hypothetical protein